jgi:ribonuclease G
MSEEILINVTPKETRVAMVENGVLQEVMIERMSKRGLVGNIYKGVVCRVLPGMQAAFVDIGLERAAFLHASDIINPHQLAGERKEVLINDLIHEGQHLLVQVVKDPLGSKGARLTTQVSIPSRYVVFLPYSPHIIGISTRIEKDEERKRLKELGLRLIGLSEQPIIEQQTYNDTLLLQAMPSPEQNNPKCRYGFIIRTAAEGASEEMLWADMQFLCRLWEDIQERGAASAAKSLIYKDFPLVIRTIRDLMGLQIEKVKIDSREKFREISEFVAKFIPELASKLEYYPGERPIFDLYSIEDEINRALERKVHLKSGGYLVVDQTEAMTTIDVNTGGFVGSRNLEETIFKTNLEAAQAIARQLRLRNLGGIIIIDFIDMLDNDHKRQVLRVLEKYLEKDHTKSHISDVSSLGLVQMTRKRTRESLERVLCEPCPTCGGRGSIKTTETVSYEIFREILRESRQFESNGFLVLASPEVVDLILDEESPTVAELAEFINRPILFQAENLYTQEQYDIVLT